MWLFVMGFARDMHRHKEGVWCGVKLNSSGMEKIIILCFTDNESVFTCVKWTIAKINPANYGTFFFF